MHTFRTAHTSPSANFTPTPAAHIWHVQLTRAAAPRPRSLRAADWRTAERRGWRSGPPSLDRLMDRRETTGGSALHHRVSSAQLSWLNFAEEVWKEKQGQLAALSYGKIVLRWPDIFSLEITFLFYHIKALSASSGYCRIKWGRGRSPGDGRGPSND